MRTRTLGLALACASCLAAASPAQAIICYVIYDRGENIIYQSTYPPLDMSNAGYVQRESLRARGEHLTFGDVPKCPTVVFLTGANGTSELSVNDVVAGLPVRGIPGTSASGALITTPAGAQVGVMTPR
jgi:hypothetical protein